MFCQEDECASLTNGGARDAGRDVRAVRMMEFVL